MESKERIQERIKELKKYVENLDDDFYGKDYSWYLEEEIEFLEEFLKDENI